MAVKKVETFICGVCKQTFTNEKEAQDCDDLHQAVKSIILRFRTATSLQELVDALGDLIFKISDVSILKISEFKPEHRYDYTTRIDKCVGYNLKVQLDAKPQNILNHEYKTLGINFSLGRTPCAMVYLKADKNMPGFTGILNQFDVLTKQCAKEKYSEASFNKAVTKQVNQLLIDHERYQELLAEMEQIKAQTEVLAKNELRKTIPDCVVQLSDLKARWDSSAVRI